jgi:hypothetical protein
VQLGQARGGWDSYDWIENLLAANMPHTEQIQPQFQQLNVGDKLPYGQDMPAAEVTYVDPGRAMSMGGWTLFLQPIDAQTTRLIVRYPWPLGNSLGDKLFYYGVAEPWHFVMESGMMLGLKQRAEMNQEQQQP